MRILITEQGIYGQRIYEHLLTTKPDHWQVFSWEPPKLSLPVIDDPSEFVPDDLPEVDLILHLSETPQAAELLPAVTEVTGAKGVIASADHAHWIPHGLRGQLKQDCNSLGAEIVFPEPLCSLTENSYSYGHKNKPYMSQIISDFASQYGWPELEVEVDSEGKITSATVKKGAPCGSSQYTCGRIIGLKANSVTPTAGLLCLHYPCLASMQFEDTPDGIDTIMHTCGKVFNEALDKALERL